MNNSLKLKYKFKRTLFKMYRVARNPSSISVLIQYIKFKRLSKTENRFRLSPLDLYPITHENTATTKFDRHYVYHTSWAARVVKEINPTKHIDISSSLYFCGLVSAFVPVDFYDYRPADLRLSNLKTQPGDLQNLPFESKSVESISCMHTIEHVGLGRYGDPVDPEGDIKAVKELKRVVKSGGTLMLVMPIGKTARIEYNAHRIYSYDLVNEMVVDDEFYLNEFAFIPQRDEEGGMIRNAKKEDVGDAYYACGCFWFKRK